MSSKFFASFHDYFDLADRLNSFFLDNYVLCYSLYGIFQTLFSDQKGFSAVVAGLLGTSDLVRFDRYTAFEPY